MARFTHCRCGAEATYIEKGNKKTPDKTWLHKKCLNADDGRGFVYHEFIAQQAGLFYNINNWTVKAEGLGFRAYAGSTPSTTLFDNEQAAWDALDVAMFHPVPEHWNDEDADA